MSCVRVTMLCVNPRFPDRPFFQRARIRRQGGRGRRTRRVGGCVEGGPRLRPTLRFSANAGGDITAWENLVFQHPPNCEPRRQLRTLTSPAPLRGALRTASSATAGLTLVSRLAAPTRAPVEIFNESTTCTCPAGPFTSPGETGMSFLSPTDHIGQESVIDGRPIAGMMRFAVRPRRFGRGYTLTLTPCPGRGRNVRRC